jgi:hypothetical protein
MALTSEQGMQSVGATLLSTKSNVCNRRIRTYKTHRTSGFPYIYSACWAERSGGGSRDSFLRYGWTAVKEAVHNVAINGLDVPVCTGTQASCVLLKSNDITSRDIDVPWTDEALSERMLCKFLIELLLPVVR